MTLTLALGLLLLIPLGIWLPRLGARRLGGDVGAAIGAAGALVVGFGVIWGLAFAVAALTGADATLQSESGFNAWKLLIFLAPASALHIRRQQRRAEDGEG
jgi:hypothetical protein